MEKQYIKRRIRRCDILSLYESLFLQAVRGFEKFCDTLFMDILNRKTRYSARHVKVSITAASRSAMRSIVLQGQKYADWLPYDRHTYKRAQLYFEEGRPFTKICTVGLSDPVLKAASKNESDMLERILLIRHAIAHSSEHSNREFTKKVVNSLTLLSFEKTPAGFLRSHVTPGVTRFETYLREMLALAVKIVGRPLS